MNALDEVLSTVRFQTLLSIRMRLAAPWAFVGARDDHVHFYVLTEGQARITFGLNRPPLRLTAGDIVLVAAGTAHAIRDGSSRVAVPPLEWPAGPVLERSGTGPITEIVAGCLAIDDPDCTPLWSALPEVLRVAGSRARDLRVLGGATQLLADAVFDGPGAKAVAARLADVLILEVIREHLRGAGAELEGWLRGLADPSLQPALSALHRRPERKWSVAALARTTGMSRTTFATKFSTQLGRGPLDYLRVLRMQRAATMLRTRDDATITQIAASSGYESEAAFRRAFCRWAGLPPATYRRRMRGI